MDIPKAKKRAEEALKSPLFLFGNILDHRVRGARLSAEQHATARKFALELGVNEAYATYLAIHKRFVRKQHHQALQVVGGRGFQRVSP